MFSEYFPFGCDWAIIVVCMSAGAKYVFPKTRKIHFEDIQVSLGEPIFYSKVAEKLEGPPAVKRKTWMDVLGYAVADLVDPEIQGVYCQKGSTEVDLEVARQVYLTMRNR